MVSKRRTRAAGVAALSIVVTACGGGGGSDSASLSANQQAFESQALTPAAGSYLLHWNLNYSGAQVARSNYAYSDFGLMTASPLTHNAQTVVQTTPRNIATTLTLVAPPPQRVLKNGAILVVPEVGGYSRISYVGADVQVDTLAADNSTVAFSSVRSNYETVALTGTMATTPADFAHFHNSFFSNAAVLNPAATWATGASYLKFTQTNKGDRYNVGDCGTATVDANPTPCATGTTLTAHMTAGQSSSSDGKTYRLADGAISTVNGVSVWVATAARPQTASFSSTVQYRIYFELGGKIYTGALIKDGAAMGGSYWLSTPTATTTADMFTFLPFHIRMNKAAHDSLAAAMKV